ncbi:MAG: GNAT family N-acetyltransferase, partial [Heyndrickxia sp.]
MKSITESIKIVQYHEDLAQSVADMWNESRESWGGDASVRTAEQVKQQEANSEDLFLYLALDGDKVVGYCGISEYKEDSNALYIRLLNVHPEYHGKKIGKQLVLKAVEKTVELEYPRIDLYTWPGNVKAVPLYKKCGFFWEDRDETTHLMNFIPLVMQNDFLKPYFEHLDWYKDNVRAIEVKPDGIKENGFTYFEYIWENETHFLRVQIEKSGRGIRLIETNDVLMEVSMKEHTQIEGRESALRLVVKNKSVEPIKVKIVGNENNRIQVSGEQTSIIQQDYTFELPVDIKEGDEPNEWVTHPRLETSVYADGLSSLFAIGIYPKKALKVKTVYQPSRYNTKKEQYCYLELENHLKKHAEVMIELPDNDYVQWDEGIYRTHIKEKGMVKIPFSIQKYGFLQSECIIKVQCDGEVFEWKETLAFSIPSFGIKAGGYDKDYLYLQNGYYKVMVRKRDNITTIGNNERAGQRTAIFPPKFGKPYIGELTKKQVSHYEWKHNDTAATMKLYYDVQKPYAMKLALCFELYGEGLLNYWVELENHTDKQVDDLFIYQPIQHHINQTYLPVKNGVVYFNDARMTNYGELKSQDVTGNWIFSDDQQDPHGITWDESFKLGFEGWYFYLEEELGGVRPNEKVRSKPVNFSLGAIKKVEEFQVFAKELVSNQPLTKEIILRPESSNPVMKNDKPLVLQRIQNRYLHGKLSIQESERAQEISIQQEDNQDFEIDFYANSSGFIPIEYGLESESQKVQGSLLLLNQDQTEICMKRVEEDQHISCVMENGDLQFKAAASYFPTLYSLSYKGQEWLDSFFPEPKPKAWWNPWAGGLRSYLNGISLFSFMKENSTSRF